MSPRERGMGRAVRMARQRRIDFVRFNVLSGKYYYQTHIIVTDPDQVTAYDPSVGPPRPLPKQGIKA